MVWGGAGVIKGARNMIGSTNPLEAATGTIRVDLALDTGRNLVHGSDSPENAEKEIALWFPEGVVDWDDHSNDWVYE